MIAKILYDFTIIIYYELSLCNIVSCITLEKSTGNPVLDHWHSGLWSWWVKVICHLFILISHPPIPMVSPWYLHGIPIAVQESPARAPDQSGLQTAGCRGPVRADPGGADHRAERIPSSSASPVAQLCILVVRRSWTNFRRWKQNRQKWAKDGKGIAKKLQSWF